MVQSFGKKRKSRKSRKVAVKKSTMYCIKRTKVGKRVVKVEVTKKGKKVVRKYASTKRALGKNVKCFRTKTQAKASLKQLKSGFGAKKSLKKLVRPYGYVACLDNDQTSSHKKFKVYKYYPVKYNYETYKIIVHKDKYTGEVKACHAPAEAKLYKVKTSGTESERKASERLAKAKANKKAREYETLGYVGIELQLVECNPAQVAGIASSPGAPPGVKSVNSFQRSLQQATRPLSLKDAKSIFHNSSQVEEALSNNNMNSLVGGRGKVIPFTQNFTHLISGGDIRTTGSGRVNAITGSGRHVWYRPPGPGKKKGDGSVRNFSDNQPYTGAGFGRSLFGRRVNYGFSKYF